MKWLLDLIVALVLLLLLGGCVAKHEGTHTWGFRVSTGYEIAQSTPTGVSTTTIDLDPLVENFIDLGWAKKEAPAEPTPVAANDDG